MATGPGAGPAGDGGRGDDRPIGVFDSGFGGLTVVRALVDLLPREDLVYLGDSARYPYGPRPAAEVRAFALEIARFLVERHQVKLLVVACNTASAAALEAVADAVEVPVVGVLDPGVRATRLATRSGRVGVIGTVGTIRSGAYQRRFAAAGDVELTCAACPGFVEFVERGQVDGEEVHVLAERLLDPLRRAAVDTLLLGCTHYPFLARTIADVMGPGVVLVSSADETAFEVRDVLAARGIARSGEVGGTCRFLSTGDGRRFLDTGRRLFGPELSRASTVVLDGAAGA